MGNRRVGHESVDLAEIWLAAYGVGHESAANRALHGLCAPLFSASLIGLLWCIPVPAALRELSPVFNWGTLFVLASIVYYFIMSITLALGALPFMAATLALLGWLEHRGAPLLPLCSLGLLIAAVGQFIGHKLEGGAASLLRDLHYVAIAPVWVLAMVYRRLGIPY